MSRFMYRNVLPEPIVLEGHGNVKIQKSIFINELPLDIKKNLKPLQMELCTFHSQSHTSLFHKKSPRTEGGDLIIVSTPLQALALVKNPTKYIKTIKPKHQP